MIRLVFIMSMVCALAGFAAAQPRHHGPPPRGPRPPGPEQITELAAELGLTAKQKQKIRDLADDARKQQVTVRAEIELIEIDLRRELEGDEPDAKKVGDYIDKISALEATAKKAHILTFLEIRKVLSKDQRAKLEAAQAERRKEHEEHMRGEEREPPPPPKGKRPPKGKPKDPFR